VKNNRVLAIPFVGLLLAISFLLTRVDSQDWIIFWVISFGIYFYLNIQKEIPIRFWVGIAVLIRLILVFSVPNFSDDFWRFLWDGRITNLGISPFQFLPSEFVKLPLGQDPFFLETISKLNSPNYHSVYPGFLQFLFWVSGKFSDWYYSVVFLKSTLFFSELGSMYLLWKLVGKNMFWYALNPLVILEVLGNVHFEGWMIFWFLLAIYLFKKNIFLSALFLGISISVKLIPLIFLPLIWKKLGADKFVLYSSIVFSVFIISMSPFLDIETVYGFKKSLGLYFGNFEFNASVYYLMRELGFLYKGYNMIGTIAPFLSGITFVLVLVHAYFSKQEWWRALYFPLGIYLMFSSIVHPWYAIPLLVLGIMDRKRWPILWSFLIFLSYIGYSKTGFQENYFILFLEYICLIFFILVEYKVINIRILDVEKIWPMQNKHVGE
jgi:alpha-1,6-mannosyltransferase